MGRTRVYIKPFNADGAYQSTWTEVTRDLIEVGSIQQSIENSDYNVGVFKFASFSMKLRNDSGTYSEPNTLRTIFIRKRSGAQVKVTWDCRSYDLVCGFFKCGSEPLGGEQEMFRGVITDATMTSSIDLQEVEFTALGFESILSQMTVPFSSIANGESISSVLYKCLNQSPFTDVVTVSAGNINPSVDSAIDDVTSLENGIVADVLNDMLLASNSVLYIKNQTVYVAPRTAGATLAKTFYGQATTAGIENISDIPSYSDGSNRIYNFWTWSNSTYSSLDTSSQSIYGYLNYDMSVSYITNATSIQAILDANRAEFAFPKIELELETPFWYDSLALNILDRVNVDYPTVFTPYDSKPLPRYGQVKYDGTEHYPYGQWSLTIDKTNNFKILGKTFNPSKETITFQLREI